MLEGSIIIIFFFILFIIQSSLVTILVLRLRNMSRVIETLCQEVNIIKSNFSNKSIYTQTKQNKNSIKKEYPSQRQPKNIPPLKDNEELLFFKKMKIDRKKKLVEMDIKIDSETK